MSPVHQGDSEDFHNSESTVSRSNRYNPLSMDRDDSESLKNFDHESVSTASIASKDLVGLPPPSTHTTEVDPSRRVIQLIKLGRNLLSDYGAFAGSVPSSSWERTFSRSVQISQRYSIGR
ncbi:hypothetical protein M378DRAFT_1032693, partial [Amanita muscaria Koide BX008]